MISEDKKKIVIENYFKSECNINMTIHDAYVKGFERGLSKAPQPERTGRWIPVTKRLPEAECGGFSKNVLVTDGKWIAISFYLNCDDMEPYWGYTGIGDITHWMPLPQTPKEET